MLFKFPLLIAMILYIIYPDTGIDVIIGYLLGFFSVNFYWLLANVLMGNRDVILTTDVTISEIFQIRFICIGASALMYMTGNIPVFYFTLPFVLIKTMNNEVVRIDLQICHAFDIQPDLTVIARADGQSDSRKD